MFGKLSRSHGGLPHGVSPNKKLNRQRLPAAGRPKERSLTLGTLIYFSSLIGTYVRTEGALILKRPFASHRQA